MKELILQNRKSSYLIFGEDLTLANFPGVEIGSIAFDPRVQKFYIAQEEGFIELLDAEVTEYVLSHLPDGALVKQTEKEIRVMCAADTEWKKQNVGATGNANMYYMALKVYAPNTNVMSFKEGDRGTVKDEMHFFENNDFAGIEADGRKYSIVWLALASYNPEADSWTYFGANSTKEKYIGWDYIVEWYDADANKIDDSSIRINLSNENCHE